MKKVKVLKIKFSILIILITIFMIGFTSFANNGTNTIDTEITNDLNNEYIENKVEKQTNDLILNEYTTDNSTNKKNNISSKTGNKKNLKSSCYKIKDNIIYEIYPETKTTDFLNKMKSDNSDIEFILYSDSNLKNKIEDGIIKSGMILSADNKNFELSVLGDLDKDGKISKSDLKAISNYIVNNEKPNKLQSLSSDISYDKKIDQTDLQRVIDYINSGKLEVGKISRTKEITIKKSEVPDADGRLRFVKETWSEGNGSITIITRSNYYTEYLVVGKNDKKTDDEIKNEKWTVSPSKKTNVTVDNLKSGDTIYARLSNGTKSGKYICKKVEDKLEGKKKNDYKSPSYVEYDAGDWTKDEIDELKSENLYDENYSYNSVYNEYNIDKLEFGGFTYKGDETRKDEIDKSQTTTSRNNTLEKNGTNGWKVLEWGYSDGNKRYVKKLVSAGSPEVFNANYYDSTTNNGFNAEYILSGGTRKKDYSDKLQLRNFDMYKDVNKSNIIDNVSCMTLDEAFELDEKNSGLYLTSTACESIQEDCYGQKNNYLYEIKYNNHDTNGSSDYADGIRIVINLKDGVYIDTSENTGYEDDKYVLKSDNDYVPDARSNISFNNIKWDSNKASVDISTNDKNCYIEYLISPYNEEIKSEEEIENSKWIREKNKGENVSIKDLNDNDKIFARLVNNDKVGNYTSLILTNTSYNYISEDMVEYNAGVWIKDEIDNLKSLYNANPKHLSQDSYYDESTDSFTDLDYSYTFGGFTYKGDESYKDYMDNNQIIVDRNKSINESYNDKSTFPDGWQVYEWGEKIGNKRYVKSLIHAGIPENFVYNGSSYSDAFNAEYILSNGTRKKDYNKYQPRDMSMYIDEKQKNLITGVHIQNMEDNVRFSPYSSGYYNSEKNNDIIAPNYNGISCYLSSAVNNDNYQGKLYGYSYEINPKLTSTNIISGCNGIRPVIELKEGTYVDVYKHTGKGNDKYILSYDKDYVPKVTFNTKSWSDGKANVVINSSKNFPQYYIEYQIVKADENKSAEEIKNDKWIRANKPGVDITLTNVDIGSCIYARFANDKVEDSGYSTFTVVDDVVPDASITLNDSSDSNVELNTNTDVNVKLNVIENESGIDKANCKWFIQNYPIYLSSNTYYYFKNYANQGGFSHNPNEEMDEEYSNANPMDNLNEFKFNTGDKEGDYYLNILLTDKAGNMHSLSKKFTVISK